MTINVGRIVLERKKARRLFDLKDDKSSKAQITIAYRRLALQNHPDRNSTNSEEATRAMVRINKAYELLLTPESDKEKHIKQFYEEFII